MNDEAACYVGGLAAEITEPLLEELFTQAGPLRQLTLKKGDTHSYALVEFQDEDSVPFAIEIMDGIVLYNKSITVKPRNNTKQEIAWKKAMSDKRRNDSRDNRNGSQPQGDSSRKRPADYYQTPRPPRNDDYYKTPHLPRNDRNRSQGYAHGDFLTPPPPPPPIRGYDTTPDHRQDRWHTPPSIEHLDPRIPPEYDCEFRARSQHSSYDRRESSRHGGNSNYRDEHRRDSRQNNYNQQNSANRGYRR